MKKILPYLVVLGIGIAIGVFLQRQPESQKVETKLETGAGQVKTDIKQDAQKAEAAAGDVKADVQAGVQKSENVATNLVDKTAEKMP